VACAAEVGSDVREQILSAGANLLIAKPANGEVRPMCVCVRECACVCVCVCVRRACACA